MPNNFLDQLLANPHGLGYGPAYPTAPNFTYDEYGQPHDAQGNKIQQPDDPSLSDSLWNIGESPARLTTALASGLSPYGAEGWQVPPAIHEPVNALMRLAQNSRFEDGHLGIPNPQNLDNQHDTATLIESLFGGNATRGAGAGERAAVAAAEGNAPLRGYHGTGGPIAGDRFDPALSNDLGPHFGTAEQANNFARVRSGVQGDGGTVYPADLNLQNPVDLPDLYTWRPLEVASNISNRYPQYEDLYDRVKSAGEAVRAAPGYDEFANFNDYNRSIKDALLGGMNDLGIDGIRYQNGVKGEGAGTSYIATKRGTVTSPLSGETLFSDTGQPSILGTTLASLKDQGQALYRTARYPFESAVYDHPLPEMESAGHSVSVPSNGGGKAGFDYIRGQHTVSPENDLDALGLGEPNTDYLNALLRKRKIEDGTLYSGNLPPFLNPALSQDQNNPPRNSLFGY